MPPSQPTIARYLLQRLHEAGVEHVFGVPGDYALRFYDEIAHSPLQHIGTTREDTAAFAADGYARARGLGALALTYGVGALSVVNAVAGAHAEQSPVVVISGAPGVREQREDPQIHHRFGPFHFQREIFERITCATATLDDPVTAFREVDRVLEAARYYSRPVYLELPRDMVDVRGHLVPVAPHEPPASDPAALDEAVEETAAALRAARAAVVLAGAEPHRRNLQDALAAFIVHTGLPVAATLTGKSVVGERHPAYLGVYEGAMGEETTRRRVEEADLLLMLGVILSDVDLGVYTARLDPGRIVRAGQNEVRVRHHRYPRVLLRDFLPRLAAALPARSPHWPPPSGGPGAPGFPRPGKAMSIRRLIGRLNEILTPEMTVVADTGDCLFAALDLRVHERTEFLASAFYTTMGFAVPAALGAQVALPSRRPLVLVGDGAFQMTGTELATTARLGLAPLVVVFNNAGYSTERYILDGPFNDVAEWRFDRLGEVFGPLHGYDAPTEEAFEAALQDGLAKTDGPTLINVRLRPDDPSPAMQRLAEHLRRRVTGAGGDAAQ